MDDSILITGCNGFVGSHLSRRLVSMGGTVVGIDRQPGTLLDGVRYASLDVANAHGILELIRANGVSRVYHLAAVANPRRAQDNPLAAVESNVMGSVSLFEACRLEHRVQLLVVGSVEQYRKGGSGPLVLREDSPLDASTMYGASKTCSELLGRAFAQQFGCNIQFTRSFNHTGPGQSDDFVLSSFARQCAELALAVRPPVIYVGNLDARRPFLDVDDVLDAYELIMAKGSPGGVYNVCSTQSYLLRELLETLISFTGKNQVEVVVDRERLRGSEPSEIFGDCGVLTRELGWKQRVPIEATLRKLYEYWHTKVEHGLESK